MLRSLLELRWTALSALLLFTTLVTMALLSARDGAARREAVERQFHALKAQKRDQEESGQTKQLAAILKEVKAMHSQLNQNHGTRHEVVSPRRR